MSAIDNIFSIMTAVSSSGKKGVDKMRLGDVFGKHNSVASRAQESTCVFPCIGPDSISTPLMSATTRNMDLVYASFVQTVVASNPLIDITVDRSPLDYMKRLHQNLKLESVLDESKIIYLDDVRNDMKSFMESNLPGLSIPDELLQNKPKNYYDGSYKVYIDPNGEYGMIVHEAALSHDAYLKYKESMAPYMNKFDTVGFATEAPITIVPDPPETRSLAADAMVQGLINNANKNAAVDTANLQSTLIKNMSSPKILDRDVKKLNDMQPHAISVRLMAVNDKQEFVQYIDFIIGIKTNLHIVKPNEIVTYLGSVLQNRNPVFNFVRWTTGEISFFKDFLLHLDEMKTDAAYRSMGYSPWLPTLRRMKEKKIKISPLNGTITRMIPNSTIVISSFEVDDIRRNYGFNVRDMYCAKKIMSELFLMAFIIIDEGSETIDILYENSQAFETYTLETLQKQVDMSSNKLGKEIGRMIAQ